MMENPIKMDDFGVPLFLETPKWISMKVLTSWDGFLWSIHQSQSLTPQVSCSELRSTAVNSCDTILRRQWQQCMWICELDKVSFMPSDELQIEEFLVVKIYVYIKTWFFRLAIRRSQKRILTNFRHSTAKLTSDTAIHCQTVEPKSSEKVTPLNTLQETNLSLTKGSSEDHVPFPQVGYLSLQDGNCVPFNF